MDREDLSDHLIHLTKGASPDKALNREGAVVRLHQIIRERRLIGGTGFIKGAIPCVCFTEAPPQILSRLLASRSEPESKYAPYGVLFRKDWLFKLGARPAIYGPAAEFGELPESFKHRHVRFELGVDYPVDHTWEREWRIRTPELRFTPDDAVLVVPDDYVRELFLKEFPEWAYLSLSDYGVVVDPL